MLKGEQRIMIREAFRSFSTRHLNVSLIFMKKERCEERIFGEGKLKLKKFQAFFGDVVTNSQLTFVEKLFSQVTKRLTSTLTSLGCSSSFSVRQHEKSSRVS